MPAYQNLCTQFYDIDKPAPPADAYAFYRKLVADAKGPVLEPMCGSGRFLLPLLKEGFQVEGFDSSAPMLESCRNKAAALGLKPKITEATFETFQGGPYALAFIPTGSFSLLISKSDALAALKKCHSLLSPGGRLVMEAERYSGTPSSGGPIGGRWVTRKDGAKIIISWLNQAGPEPQVNACILRYELVKDGKLLETEIEDFPLRFYVKDELGAMAKEAGFSSLRFYKPFAFEDAGDKDEVLILDAHKV